MRGRHGAAAALAAGAMLLLAGCTAPPWAPAATSTQAHMQGEWMLASATDADGAFWPDTAASGVDITLAIDGNAADGRTPCNGYGLELEGGPDDVRVGALQIQEAACLDTHLMEIEGRYVAALPGLDVTADEAALELTGDGVRLVYERHDGDADAEAPTATPATLEGDWTLVSASDAQGSLWPAPHLIDDTQITLTVEADGGSGFSTCNGFGFWGDREGTSLALDGFSHHHVGCASPAHAEVEDRFFEAFQATTSDVVGFTADGTSTLTLLGTDTALIFERTPR